MNSLQKKILERNEIFILIRGFFKQHKVLEVDTPLLRPFTVTDPYMNAFKVKSSSGEHQGYLQTSPEYAMKQLLCSGSGDIFQLSKMFRSEEKSDIHASEFTMLEWYRVGYDHHQLIQEACDLIQLVLGKRTVTSLSYESIFLTVLGINPFKISIEELCLLTHELIGDVPKDLLFDNYLTLLFSEMIEPAFDKNIITVIHSYPESQASLAKTKTENNKVIAERFEIYTNGMELANGFNELTDSNIQLSRFNEDNVIREKLGYRQIDIDKEFVASLKSGLPDCAGVALGVDRLLMAKLNIKSINDVNL